MAVTDGVMQAVCWRCGVTYDFSKPHVCWETPIAQPAYAYQPAYEGESAWGIRARVALAESDATCPTCGHRRAMTGAERQRKYRERKRKCAHVDR